MIKRNVKICEKITSCKKIVIEFYKKKKAKTQICKEKQNKIQNGVKNEKNIAGNMATKVACGWARAVMKRLT